MSSIDIVKRIKVKDTPRLRQLCSMFDLDVSTNSTFTYQSLFDVKKEWNIGVIVGSSGSGKTTLAKHLWNDSLILNIDIWDKHKSVVDCFPSDYSI